MKHTCETCLYKDDQNGCYCRTALYNEECWRPRLRSRILAVALFALIGLALVVGWAWLAGAFKPVPEYKAQATDFPFYERENWRIEELKRWRVKSALVWTIYSTVGQDDGYAISKGE